MPSAHGAELLWEHATGFHNPQAQVVDASNPSYLYVALKGGGLKVLRVSGRAPDEVAHVPRRALADLDAMNLWLEGDLLLVALGDFFRQGRPAGMALIDVRRPREPAVISTWRSQIGMRGSAAVVCDPERRRAYLAAMHHGVLSFDISEPGAPRLLSTFQPDPDFPVRDPKPVQRPNARGLALRGDHLFVCYDAGGLRVLDVSDPAEPSEVARYLNRGMKGKQSAYNNIHLDGDTAYAAIDYAGVEVLDITDPRRVRQLAWWNPWRAETAGNLWLNSPGHTNQIAFDRRRKRVFLSAGGGGLVAIDVLDPRRPRRTEGYGEEGNGLGVWGLAMAPDGSVLYPGYIRTVLPFKGTWAGVKAVRP